MHYQLRGELSIQQGDGQRQFRGEREGILVSYIYHKVYAFVAICPGKVKTSTRAALAEASFLPLLAINGLIQA